MRDQIKWLGAAVAKKAITESMTHYAILGTEICATDGNIIAGTPFDSKGVKCLVPGKLLEDACKAAPAAIELSATEDTLSIKGHKFRASVPIRDVREWAGNQPRGEWKPVPTWLGEVMRDLSPFMGNDMNRAFTCGIAIYQGYAWATNTRALARSLNPLPKDDTVPSSLILPMWVLEFLEGRTDKLTHWMMAPTYMAFKWDDGSWVRSNLINGEPMARMPEVLGPAVDHPGFRPVPDEAPSALDRAAYLLDDVVEVTASSFKGVGKLTAVEIEMEAFADTTDAYTPFKVKIDDLRAVLSVAKEWDPRVFPKPVPFRSANVIGMFTGIR